MLGTLPKDIIYHWVIWILLFNIIGSIITFYLYLFNTSIFKND